MKGDYVTAKTAYNGEKVEFYLTYNDQKIH